MDYTIEELVPIVGTLAAKYTSNESTSITYERAEQLMEAVQFCIHEYEDSGEGSLLSGEILPASQAYELGLNIVKDKTARALSTYNEIITNFSHYESKCLCDTFVKGIPEFFKWYDVWFEPQHAILTLDYPLLKDISGYEGIDKIFEYIRCIGLEQAFLNGFPMEHVINVLSEGNPYWRDSIDNICEPVLAYTLLQALEREPLKGIEERLADALDKLIQNNYEGNTELRDYLACAIENIAVRLKALGFTPSSP